MPSREDHLWQARHNEAVLQSLEALSDNVIDWKTTVLFYTALHYVDAYLATLVSLEPGGIHPKGHQTSLAGIGRNNYVAALMRPVYRDYEVLYTRSLEARYGATLIQPAAYDHLRARRFTAVVTFVKARLNLP